MFDRLSEFYIGKTDLVLPPLDGSWMLHVLWDRALIVGGRSDMLTPMLVDVVDVGQIHL